jgi:O-antigen ligase
LYYLIAGFFLLDGIQAFGVIDRMFYGVWAGKSGDKITQTLSLLLILSGMVLFAGRRRRDIGAGAILALAAMAFLLLSTLWSFESAATIRQGVIYLFVVLGAIGIAGTLEADEFMELLGFVCLATAAASLALLVLAPSYAIMNDVDFQGVFPHKNFLGQAMVIGALASLHCIRSNRRRGLNLIFLLVFVGTAFASKSATSWATILVFISVSVIAALLRGRRGPRLIGVFLSIVLVIGLVIFYVDPDFFLEIAGKDRTLTGRTEIWDFVIACIWMKPMLGWGYFGFWTMGNPSAIVIADAMHWWVTQSHNGLLEMLLNIGAVGTAIFLVMFFRTLVLGVRCLRGPSASLGLSTILSCLGIVLIGISETVLLAATQPSTSVFFVTGLMCERALRARSRQRVRVAPGARHRGPSMSAPAQHAVSGNGARGPLPHYGRVNKR